MAGIYRSFKSINEDTLAVVKSLNILHVVDIPSEPAYVSLSEAEFVLTEQTKRCTGVATAHDLSQYRNRFRSIRLNDNYKVFMDLSIAIRKENGSIFEETY